MPWFRVNREILIVSLSLMVQVPLAVFLGHYYDERVFMATGYIVSSGLSPYQPHTLVNVYPNPLLNGVNPVIGYPPPWPLLLGIIYRLSFNLIPNLFLYNFAIKVPIIISNIGLAYLVKNVLQRLNASEKKIKMAWLFLLFNPFVLLTTSAWGQFDSLVALLCVASLYFLSQGRIEECALFLGLAFVFKPIALPLVGLPFLYSIKKPSRKNLRYLLIFAAVAVVLYIGPFVAFGWNLSLDPSVWFAYPRVAGGMSIFSLNEILTDSLTLPVGFDFLGYLWIPALMVGYFAVYRSRSDSLNALVQQAIGLTLIFFLTRTWLSEPNVILILALMLIVVETEDMSFRNFSFLWIVPLVFMFLNTSFPQLFFLVYPPVITALSQADQQIRSIRLVAKFLVVVLWQVLSWSIVVKMLRWNKNKQAVQELQS